MIVPYLVVSLEVIISRITFAYLLHSFGKKHYVDSY